jgi:hypothetical protein
MLSVDKARSLALRSAMAWLVQHTSIPSSAIARALGSYPGRVRNAAWWADPQRTRHDRLRPVLDYNADGAAHHRAWLKDARISSVPSFGAEPTADQTATLERLARDIDQCRTVHTSARSFADGFSEMMRIVQRFGAQHSAEAHRLRGRIYEHATWFATHLGRSRSALRAAHIGMAWYELAYHEDGSRTKGDLKGLADTALTASAAALHAGGNQTARALLQLFFEASRAADNTIGGEYHRQNGMLQWSGSGTLDRAKRSFELAGEAMERCGESSDRGHVVLWGRRQLNVIEQRWDRGRDSAQELYHQAMQDSEKHPTRAVTMAVWSAAAGSLLIALAFGLPLRRFSSRSGM